MSYYFISVFGVILLTINIINWRRLMQFNVKKSPKMLFNISPAVKLNMLFAEWFAYSFGDKTLRGMKSFIVSMIIIISLLIANDIWLQFELQYFLPGLILVIVIAQIRIGRALYRKNFDDTFPEVLSTINSAISAGNSIHQALHRCGKNITGNLGAEFNRIERRLNLGEEPERVFIDAWKKYPYREFYFFVIVMLVSIQRGGQLRTLISKLSKVITDSKNMERRKKAMTSEARASAKIVAAIPMLFFMGMKYFSPENFNFIIHDSTGRYILYYVISSEALGMFIIWLLLRRAI